MRQNWFILLLFAVITGTIIHGVLQYRKDAKEMDAHFDAYLATEKNDTVWRGPGLYQIPITTDSGRMIRYGYELISHTSFYLGPKGAVAHISNGMNCQNCHLEAGTKPYGNNYGKVYSTYPLYRPRSNSIQGIQGRVNDCLERSLNGHILDTASKEMKAIYAYIKWLGNDVPKGYKPGGTGIMKMAFLNRAADVVKGKVVYENNCQRCHGSNGQGLIDTSGIGYVYPPLWGNNSYNDGAGIFRLSSFAGFVKNNMPNGIDFHSPQISTEQAWDVAAFVNSQPRPHKNQSLDWKITSEKPIDFPFGPFTDTFTEQQHKYGPFLPIIKAHQTTKISTSH